MPWFLSRPKDANQLLPLRKIVGDTATVSTFVTVDGRPNNPTPAGKGGFNLGFPCFPSKDSIDHLSQEIKDCVTPEAGLLFRAFASGLLDTNVLVQRGFFDILLSKMPLNSPVLQNIASEKDRELLIMSVASTALRKDMSLNRRLWNWLLGGEESAIGMSLTSGSSEHQGNDESISRSIHQEE